MPNHVIGVCHVEAHAPLAVATLRSLRIDASWTIFVEPSAALLSGVNAFLDPRAQAFFGAIFSALSGAAPRIVPLGTPGAPSSHAEFLLEKLADELAEEEWAATVVRAMHCEPFAVVIGDTHASRLGALLGATYIQAAPRLLSTQVAQTWREALEGRGGLVIDPGWLDTLRARRDNEPEWSAQALAQAAQQPGIANFLVVPPLGWAREAKRQKEICLIDLLSRADVGAHAPIPWETLRRVFAIGHQ
jgi:hypothetical protein